MFNLICKLCFIEHLIVVLVIVIIFQLNIQPTRPKLEGAVRIAQI